MQHMMCFIPFEAIVGVYMGVKGKYVLSQVLWLLELSESLCLSGSFVLSGFCSMLKSIYSHGFCFLFVCALRHEFLNAFCALA